MFDPNVLSMILQQSGGMNYLAELFRKRPDPMRLGPVDGNLPMGMTSKPEGDWKPRQSANMIGVRA